MQLFERLPRRVVVTEAGSLLLERARRVLLEADDLTALSERERGGFASSLRVGIIPTVAPYLLPEATRALRTKYPRLSLVWEETKTAELLDKLRAGSLDAGLLAWESEGLDDLLHVVLGTDPFHLAVAPDHPLAKTKRVASLSALDGETVLLLDDGHCFRDQALAVCQRIGAEEASVRATSLTTLAQLVASGLGVTLLPQLALRTENRARTLVTRPFSRPAPARRLVLAWRKSSPFVDSLPGLGQSLSECVARVIEKSGAQP